ncbi:hypothetical protein ACSU1N_03955 [Thermogladius sp. 4427co]|uniref:hypothetical protein n=1 Tax=Thermogladius sp. 4427co TaxID=3450718 RepID=UPI003F7B1D59
MVQMANWTTLLAVAVLVAGLAGFITGYSVREPVVKTVTMTTVVPTTTTTLTQSVTVTERQTVTTTAVRKMTYTKVEFETVTVTVAPSIIPLEPAQNRGSIAIVARPGEPVSLGGFEFTVLDAKASKYVTYEEQVVDPLHMLLLGRIYWYKAPEGFKAVLVTIGLRNTGSEPRYLIDVFNTYRPRLITAGGGVYEWARFYDLESIPTPLNFTSVQAVGYYGFNLFTKIAPGDYLKTGILFLIPENEAYSLLYMTYQPDPAGPVTVVLFTLS